MADKKTAKKKNIKTRVLISGYIGFSNFGDDAMLQLLVDHLKEKDCEITALSSNPKETKDAFGIKAVNYKDYGAIIDAMKQTDILISGGGNLFQNETSNASLLYYASIVFLAKLFLKKVFIYSQGIGPVKGKIANFLTWAAFKSADDITVRDMYSQKKLLKWKIKSKFAYDALWNIQTPQYDPQNIVGIQLRNYKKANKDMGLYLAKYVDMFFSDMLIKIYALENKYDAPAAYNLEKALKARNNSLNIKVVLYKTPEQIVNEFSKLNYLIAMRLHAIILGLKIGVKTLPVSYNIKVDNLAKEFGLISGHAGKEINFHSLLTDLTTNEQLNDKIMNAKKRQYNWNYLDALLK